MEALQRSMILILSLSIHLKAAPPTLVGDATDGFVDKTLTSTNYTVKVTPKDGSSAKVAGQES